MGVLILRSSVQSPASEDPFDLSPYYSLMESVLPGWSSDIGWPEAPDVSGGTENVTNVTELRAAVALANRTINIAAGTYDLGGTPLNISGNNLLVNANDDVDILGVVESDNGTAAHHVRWNGGNILTSGSVDCTFRAVTDFLFDNVYMEAALVLHRLANPDYLIPLRRVAFINSTVDSRNNTQPAAHPMIIIQGGYGTDPNEDFILANTKLLGGPTGGEYTVRVQNTKRVIIVEGAHNVDTPASVGDRGIRFTTNTQYVVVAGRAAKPFQMLGNANINYIGDSNEWDYAIQDSAWDHINMYNIRTESPTAFASNLDVNSGEITNFTMYSSTDDGSSVTGLGTFTTGSGYNGTIQPWDGSTLPNVSTYGAQR